MPGAKTGWPPRMIDQFKDYAIIGIILFLIYLWGQALADAAAHPQSTHGGLHLDAAPAINHGEAEAHEPAHHGSYHYEPAEETHHEEETHYEPEEEEHGARRVLSKISRVLSDHHVKVDPALDMQVTLGICVLLISITIFFEMVKHHLEHTVPQSMAAILQAMFGELTVLGFIALCTYFMIKFGLIEFASMVIYHDPEHLLHLFEDIHFMLFFVMIIFLIEAIILIFAALNSEAYFMRFEALVANAPVLNGADPAGSAAAPAVAQLLATYKVARQHCWTRLCVCPRVLWSFREAEAKEELTYALLRARFLYPPIPKPGTPPLPSDFDFSAYLRRRMMHEVAHSLHISPNTWVAIIFLLGLILYIPVLEQHELGANIVNVYAVTSLCWGLWLYSFCVRAKLGHIMYMLTPPHALLDGAPKAFDEEGPTVALLAAHCDAPPYESLTPSTDASKHERLFWRGRDGPAHLLFLLRFQMLWTAICLAVCYTWMTSRPGDTPFLLLGFLPVFDVLLVAPKRIMPMLTVVTSIEMMKKAGDIKETVDEMKMEKTLKMLKMLQTLRGQAKRAARLAAADKQKRPGAPKPKPKEIDPVQEEELREAFDLFDKDGSGQMDTAELGDCLKSLGVELDETALNALAAQMDTSGDGIIDFEEFKEAMASSVDEKETPGQIASSIFQMLDSDGSGKITSQELKDMVKTVNPDLTDDDVAAAMTLFDTDNSGQITEKEFRQALEKMKTFDQA